MSVYQATWLGVCCATMTFVGYVQGGSPVAWDEPLHVASTDRGQAVRLPDGKVLRHAEGGLMDGTVLHLADSDVAVALWREVAKNGREVDYYSVSLDGVRFAAPRQAHHDLRLRYATFDPLASAPVVAPVMTAPLGYRLHIVQFLTQPLEGYKRAIAAAGGEVKRHLPDSACLVEMDPEVAEVVVGLPFVRWVGPYHPAYKLEDTLLGSVAFAGVDDAVVRYRIQVTERGLEQKTVVADRIKEMGGTIDALSPSGFLFEASLTAAQLASVVRMDEVLFVDRWSPPQSYMDIVRASTGANVLELATGFTGQGVRGEVMDNYLYTNHPEFQSNPPILHGDQMEVFPPNNHGTATFGCVFGDGSEDPTSRGMLPDGQGIFADFQYLEDRYAHTAELLEAPYEAVFQSNSWGTGLSTTYTNKTAEMDDILFTHDLLVVQSQANTRSTLSDEAAWAKNIVSVGGVKHKNTLDRSDDHWSLEGTGASIGPADDGRIKPDLCHFYDGIRTTYPWGMHVSDFGGTSAAAPIVAGHFGLFFQMWSESTFGNDVPGLTVFENRPHMSTAKAMMINAARQYPFEGEDHDLTRVHQGWGLPDLERLYELRDSFLIVDETDVIANLETNRYDVLVASSDQPLRVTLVYTDPQGTVGAEISRVNDLTLKVRSPSRVSYYGNHGLSEGVWSLPGGEADTINTVENVFVEAPEPGTWTVEVIAVEIVEDAHVETPRDDADYALVVSGIVPVKPGDCDGDGLVGLTDYEVLASCLSGPDDEPMGEACDCADLDLDGDVDLGDIAKFSLLRE